MSEMWVEGTMETYHLESIAMEFLEEGIGAVIYFYHEVAMGEHLRILLTPEQAIFVLKADLDLRTPPSVSPLLLGEVTIWVKEHEG